MIKQNEIRLRKMILPPVIQFGPPRTGSTLLWNALRICFPGKKVLKRHQLSGLAKSRFYPGRIVASIRNPLDAMSSSIQRYGTTPSAEVIRKQILEFERNGIWDILKLKGNKNALILRYEEFAFDFDYLFGQLESFFDTVIPVDLKQQVMQEFSIESVEERAGRLGSFRNYDKSSHIHGKHVSPYRGATGYYRDFLGKDEIETIYRQFSQIFEAFGYGNPLLQ